MKIKQKFLAFLSVCLLSVSMLPAMVQAEPMTGEVKMFAGNFAPRGWAFCQGQLMSINDNQALFSILGTTYGGDGRTNFALPDLRGRIPVGTGQGGGLSVITAGQSKGVETHNIENNNLPYTDVVNNIEVEDKVIKSGPGATAPTLTITKGSIGSKNIAKISNYQPSLGMNYIISLQGVYPSRN